MWVEDLLDALKGADRYLSIVTRRLISTQNRDLRIVRSSIVSALHQIRWSLEILQDVSDRNELRS